MQDSSYIQKIKLSSFQKPNMHYTQAKAEKLAEEFNYLLGKFYFPLGEEGKEFRIYQLNPEHDIEYYVRELQNDHSRKADDKKADKAWRVLVTIDRNGDRLKKDLETVLKVLKIRHDIQNVFNASEDDLNDQSRQD